MFPTFAFAILHDPLAVTSSFPTLPFRFIEQFTTVVPLYARLVQLLILAVNCFLVIFTAFVSYLAFFYSA